MPRSLLPGQRAQLITVDVDSGASRVVYESDSLLFEAPNWTTDDNWLVVNGDGGLYKISPRGGRLEKIELGGLAPINNDHVLSPDGHTAYVSSEDGHLYSVALAGGIPRRVSNDNGPNFIHYLHGISPDGETLAYIGMEVLTDGGLRTNVYTVPVNGGPDRQLTNDEFPDDGAEFSADGRWIYFNSERGSTTPGHAQLFRMTAEGGEPEQLTTDERVNWFPHPSPTGGSVAFVSFPPGTLGHPENKDVILFLLNEHGAQREIARAFGGQGTMNVPSWDPTGQRLAYVTYPVG